MKTLIILRPCKVGNSYKLGLYSSDFRRLAQGQQVTSLSVQIGEEVFDLSESIQVYTRWGSLTNPGIASWIAANRYEDPKYLFLFELTVENGVHTFSYLGTQKSIFQMFIKHWK